MAARWVRISLAVQVGAVAALFIVALGLLWRAGLAAVDRERRQAEAVRDLERAEGELARRGARGLVIVPEWPATLDPVEWHVLDRWLAEEGSAALAAHPGAEGGYYVPSADLYLGYAPPSDGAGGEGPKVSRRRSSEPPPREFDLIDALVRDALSGDRGRSALIATPGGPVAVRATPIWANGRRVAAAWILARLDDPLSLDRALSGYRRAAAIALGGIALALLLTLGLARTVRRQARERGLLQQDLRRTERLAALGKLLAGVAHEVRNPLAGIRSTAQLWRRGLGPDPASIDAVVAEVDRLEGIVSRLLQFSRADAQALAPGDLNAVVSEASGLAEGPAEGQGVRVETDLATGLPLVAMSPPALVQVLRNLTTNALIAMPDGGTLRLTTRLDSPGRTVSVIVSDTGPGLPAGVRPHLFEPFFTTRPDGTGLGLAIAREIALGHGGELRAEPDDGRSGAVFTLTLPIARTRAGRRGVSLVAGEILP